MQICLTSLTKRASTLLRWSLLLIFLLYALVTAQYFIMEQITADEVRTSLDPYRRLEKAWYARPVASLEVLVQKGEASDLEQNDSKAQPCVRKIELKDAGGFTQLCVTFSS